MNSFEIRSAGSADLAALVRLNALVQAQHAAAHADLFVPPAAAELQAHFEWVLDDQEYRVRLAVAGGHVFWRIEHVFCARRQAVVPPRLDDRERSERSSA